MVGGRWLFALLAALVASAAPAAAQPAPDCTKAKTPAEKAICGHKELADADSAMKEAYSGLIKQLKLTQRPALRADQRDWIIERDDQCLDQKDDALVKCLLAATNSRRHFLAGEGDNGAAGAPPLLPVYIRDARADEHAEIAVAYPQFAPPRGSRFNHAIQNMAANTRLASGFPGTNPRRGAGTTSLYQLRYDITYLDPRLVSVTLQFAMYEEKARSGGRRSAVLWNLETDKPVELNDLFARPEHAAAGIYFICKAKAEQEDWEFFDHPNFAAVIVDMSNWAVDKEGVTIMFAPGSEVAGPHDCRLTYAGLKTWLKPGGMLPPG